MNGFRVCTACEILLLQEKEEDEVDGACGHSMEEREVLTEFR
jgi:hypothetical protein